MGFIERGDDFAELDAYVAGDSRKLFALTAETGMGKSTPASRQGQSNFADHFVGPRSRRNVSSFWSKEQSRNKVWDQIRRLHGNGDFPRMPANHKGGCDRTDSRA